MLYFRVNNLLRILRNKTFIGRVATSSVSTHQPFPLLQDTLDLSNGSLSSAKEISKRLLNQLELINQICYAGGGEKGQMIHVKKNKKVLPREKLKLLFDEDADTLELSLQAGLGLEYGDIPGASTITIIGRISGRYCMVTVNDGTLKGGTFYPITLRKSLRAQNISHTLLLPAISVVDSGGAFLPLQSEIFPDKMHGGRGFYNQAVDGANGIPQMALICGSCTAGGAYIPSMCEDAGIVHKIGTMFLGGPPLVKAATGEDISAEDLGGATLHCKVSGGLDYFAATEHDGFEVLRDLVATINLETVTSDHASNPPCYSVKDIDALCGLETLDRKHVLSVISRIVDRSRFREFKADYGQNLITGFAMFGKSCAGIIANCGPVTYEDGLKGAHFIQICQHRQLPLVFLQNSGPLENYVDYMDSKSEEERALLLRGRVAMTASVSCATIPKVVFNIKSCHADDNYSMCGPSFEPNFIFCWPGAETTYSLNSQVLPLSQGEKDKRKKLKNELDFNFPSESCWYFASRSLYDGIIAPSETRKVIYQCLRIFEQKDRIRYRKKTFPVFRF